MTDHTPTPWECDWGTIPPDGPGTYCDVYIDGGDTIIARVNDCIESGHANASFIVKAVNNHDLMLAALERIAIACTDNMGRSCDHRMALDFVRQVANGTIDLVNAP